MRILITGATGFLGKWVLKLLLRAGTEHSADIEVTAVSRSKSTHPDPRVRVIQGDLSDPGLINLLPEEFDTVIHLAGLYRFGSPFHENYRANVLGTQNLLHSLERSPGARILHASTYAVGIGNDALCNTRLPELPPHEHAYAYTKALAERLMENAAHCSSARARHPVTIFRLGILMGDSQQGAYEKTDGPYKLLERLRALPANTPVWLPADPEATLPVVAVDEAARILVNAAFSARVHAGVQYDAVYRSDSVSVRELVDSIAAGAAGQSGAAGRFKPLWGALENPLLLKAAGSVLGTSLEDLVYAKWKVRLEPGAHEHELSHWSALAPVLLGGLK